MEFIFFWFALSVLVGWFAGSRGRSGFGYFFLALLLSPLLVWLALLIMPKPDPNAPTPETHIRCPDCRELILKEARVCKHCGCKLVPTV